MSRLTVALGRQLAKPHGVPGWALSHAMRIANRRPVALAIGALGIEPGDAVLDLGCGWGDSVPQLLGKAQGGTVHGVDHAVEAMLAARDRHPGARFHLGSFHELPFSRASFDRVLAVNVAYFWRDAGPVLAELRRVIRPGGRLAVYVTEALHLRRLGLHLTGTHRMFQAGDLHEMLGPLAVVSRVEVGFGVQGLIATLDY